MSAPGNCEAELVEVGIDMWTFDSKAPRGGLAPQREDVVEGSRMWGTFMGSGKKHMALAAVMAAANSSAGGAACSSKARRRRHGVIAGTRVKSTDAYA